MKKTKLQGQKQISGYLSVKGGLTYNGEIWGGGVDGTFLYLDVGGGFRTVCICQSLKNYTRKSNVFKN